MRLSCHRFRANEVRLWLSLIMSYSANHQIGQSTKISGELASFQ
jgi:hypothetical protein